MSKVLKIYASLTFLFFYAISLQAQDEVMNYTELQTYLPTTLSGYTAGNPGGSILNMQGMSFSTADIRFTNDEGDEVNIMPMLPNIPRKHKYNK